MSGLRGAVTSVALTSQKRGPHSWLAMPNWLSRTLVARFESEHPAVDLAASSQDITMQSILEILVVNTKSGKSKKTGNDYSIPEAQCVLKNDDGTVAAVGVLVIPKQLEELAKPGSYTGSFALEAATFGENQGRIVAKLVGLTPLPADYFRRKPGNAPQVG